MTAAHGPRTGRPPTRADRGMVSSPHYLATGAGLAALRAGGSAVDATIAVNALLCVAYPHMAGLGGDGFWLLADPDATVHGLNASGPAARAATRDYYGERGHTDVVPSRGALSALTVPGAVDGWRLAHERYGRLPWADLFDDAIHYARHGVPVARSLADWLVEDLDLLNAESSTARLFAPEGRARREGERIAQPELARSLELIAAQGARAGFYEGDLGRRFCAGIAAQGSPLHPDDLAAYHAHWEEPIATDYRGHTVYEMPSNTQGFAVLQILNVIEGYDVTGWGDGTPDYYHHLAEAVKLAFADRDEWLTDRHWVDIPVSELLDKAYAARRRELIRPDRAMVMAEVEPGIRFGPQARRRAPLGDTCAFSVVDDRGLVVSAIQSIYHDFGAGLVSGDTGIIPQNRGSFFSLDEGHPNRMEPGKRTFHTLIPGLVCVDGRPWLAFGSMGGEGQPQSQAALLTCLIDFGYDVQQAIEAPRWLMGRAWGTTAQDMSLEGRISDEVVRELQRRGQPVRMLPNWDDNMGHAQAIRIDFERGLLEAGADPRGDGAAIGY
ncbi:gamma-glutamyltransferase [Micromonospora craniellae]|uniref:Glutathione hydrolase proenzyme n=1 Tax=Micromonospora craniellae TaxID=2294034 RepID=A0A372G347_9ACTN|nr:gamma-glutamyltransferase [Micromonospora craniellae]QOC91064.1 gamma-glutamyltransferase [Micromonospora craniellae]RFS47189.1 gamma-glutamyltransferase [Micromonospora craniellae]